VVDLMGSAIFFVCFVLLREGDSERDGGIFCVGEAFVCSARSAAKAEIGGLAGCGERSQIGGALAKQRVVSTPPL
ncbi:hypothetical protein, partial [Salmonella enterica]|uniref:hypothetical protein n=1 Tax=Salmonella enterica TaxID=28901 RepID=UPI003CEC2A56